MEALLRSREVCLRLLEATERTLDRACDQLDRRIRRCEINLKQHAQEIHTRIENDIHIAARVVEREVRNKSLLSQWCSHFVAEGVYEDLDPIAFAFLRLSLNVAAAHEEVSYETLRQSNVHSLLVSLTGFERNVIVGPALLALCQISLDDRMRHDIIHAGVLPHLLHLAVHSRSSAVLSMTAKLCASLSMHPPNKPLIATSGLFHALIDLSVGAHVRVTDQVRRFAVQALLNLTHGSDANRSILVDLDGIRPLLECVMSGIDPLLVRLSILVFANVAFRSAYTVGKLLREAVDVAVLETLSVTDVINDSAMTRSCLLALTNCTVSARYRSHLAPSALAPILRVCNHSIDLVSVSYAANLTSALVFDHPGNKATFGGGALVALLDRLLICCATDSEGAVECVDSLCLAIASLLLFVPNHELFNGDPSLVFKRLECLLQI